MEFIDYLKILVDKDGSDLYLTTGAVPSAKFHGHMTPIDRMQLPVGRVKEIAYKVMDKEQIQAFEKKPEMNLAISETGVGRFRVNIFKQRNEIAMVVRNIKTEIPDMKMLQLPDILSKVIMAKRGLVLFIGGTGSGKSTSLAALIDYRNQHAAGHIITIEDPIEFIHLHKKSIINQREVGVDTDSYSDALINTLRQAPDVILIGEIRDQSTMEHALAFAETGHLAISTLHANNSNQALDRIINFFPEERRNQLLLDLSLNLRAFVAQRLVPTLDNKRVAAIEVLLGTPIVSELIRKGEVAMIKEVMEKSEMLGMQTFDAALFKLHAAGKISLEEALKNADSANNLRLRVSLSAKNQEKKQASPPQLSLSLEEIENDEDEDAKAPLELATTASSNVASFKLDLSDDPDEK